MFLLWETATTAITTSSIPLFTGVYYQSESSPIQRVSLGRKCDPLRAFSTKAQEQHELDAGILAGIISTVSVLLLVILVVLVCR